MSATTTATKWDSYCNLTYAAAHQTGRDLIDFCADLGELELEAHHLADLLNYADECGASRGPVLRAHLADLRHIRDLAALALAEAEAAA